MTSCDQCYTMTTLLKIFNDIWPLYFHHRLKETEYQKQSLKNIHINLPAILQSHRQSDSD